jgi:hypothetical protein
VGFFWKLVLTDQYTWLESPDIAYQVLPWYQFQAAEWHRGQFPLWDPNHWGGQSLIGQAQPGAAYPPNWILFLLPLRNGWMRQAYLHWYFVLIHFMAALFCYWLCRDLKRSRAASVAAGATFALGGYVGVTDWPQMLNGAVWTPLVFLFLLRAIRGERAVASAAASGVFLGVSWLSGHHQIPIFVSLAVAAVWLFHIVRPGRPDWRMTRLAAVFGAFLLLAGALQMLPAYEYGKLAKRWVGTPEPRAWNEPVPYSIHSNFSLYPISLLGISVPGIHRHADPFIGVVAVSLALLAIALGWRYQPVRLFGAIAVGGLLFSLGRNNVLHGIIYSLVPLVEKARNPSMAVAIFHFAVAVLVAYGIDLLLSDKESDWLRRTTVVLVGFGAFLCALLLGHGVVQKPPADDRVGVTALIALLLALLLQGWRKFHLERRSVALFALMLLLVELGNVSGFLRPHRSEKDRNIYLKRLQEHADIREFLRRQSWPVRIEVSDQDVPFNFGDWHGIDVFGGYVASLPANLLRLELHTPRTRQLFGVNYSLTRNPPGPDQRLVFEGEGDLKVHWNANAFPRVWTVHETKTIHHEGEIVALTQDESFDLRRKTFLFGDVPSLESCDAADQVQLLDRDSNRVTIQAEMACRGMVVLSDSYFPGWKATVDGRPARIYEAYSALRGVVVDRGSHQIEMRYRPGSVYLGAIMTGAGLIGAALLALRSRRGRAPGRPT